MYKRKRNKYVRRNAVKNMSGTVYQLVYCRLHTSILSKSVWCSNYLHQPPCLINTRRMHLLFFLVDYCCYVELWDAVSWQLGLVEREINELLQRNIAQQTQRSDHNQTAPSAVSETGGGSAACTVPQREIGGDDICPICQEELLASHQPVTFCRSGPLR